VTCELASVFVCYGFSMMYIYVFSFSFFFDESVSIFIQTTAIYMLMNRITLIMCLFFNQLNYFIFV
jgi:hypothetical protein